MDNLTSFKSILPTIAEGNGKNKVMIEIFNNFLNHLSSLNNNYIYTYNSPCENFYNIAMYSKTIFPELQQLDTFFYSLDKSSNMSNFNAIFSNDDKERNFANQIVFGTTTFSFSKNGAIYLHLYYANSCSYRYDAETNSSILSHNNNYSYHATFAFFSDGTVYIVSHNKHIPCTLKIIASTFHKNYLAYLFLKTYLNYFQFPLFIDIVRNIEEGLKIYNNDLELALDTIQTNFTVKELKEYYSIQNAIQSHYKTCQNIPKSVNKMFLAQATNRALACRNVKENEIQKIYKVPFSCRETPKSVIASFYTNHIKNINTSYGSADKIILSDYINMCDSISEPYNLNIKSFKKIINAHNLIFTKYIFKKYKKYNRKKLMSKTIKGKINPLYNLSLPSDFEIINSDKRLLLETVKMHNCVVTYRDKIIKGKSLIAHLEYNGEHCTLEIICKNNKRKKKFSCVQIFKECNQPVSQETFEYVKTVLEEINNR